MKWKSVIRLEHSLWVDGLFEQGLSRISVLIVGWVGGDVSSGLYFQAQRLISIPHTHFCSLINRYAFHLFSRAVSDAERSKIRKRLSLLLVPPMGLGTGLIIWKGNDWIGVLLGSEWTLIIEILQAMAVALVFMTLFSIHKVYFLSMNSSRCLFQARIWQVVGFSLPFLVFQPRQLWVFGLSFSLMNLFGLLSTTYSLFRMNRRVLLDLHS